MYSLCRNKNTNYYLKVRNYRVRLISCLPDSNRNLVREFVQVSGNWFADELPYPLLPREVGSYCLPIDPVFLFCLLMLVLSTRALIYYVPLLQTAKNSFQTSKLCMEGT